MNKVLWLLMNGMQVLDWSYFEDYLVRVHVRQGFMEYDLFVGRWVYLSMEEM